MSNNAQLGNSARRGVLWAAMGTSGCYIVNFLFNIFMARLLSPQDFGICFMPSVFFGLANVCINCGFSAALVRDPELSEKDENTAFWFCLGMGILMFTLIWLAAPLIAEFYHTAILTDIVRVCCVSLMLAPLGTIHYVRYQINLDFKTPATLNVISVLVHGVCGVLMALAGWGLWAIVLSQILSEIVGQVILWRASSWRPRLQFSKQSLRKMLAYGLSLQATSVMNNIFDNLYPILIGRYFSSYQVGLYMRAYNWARIPSGGITEVINRVTYPVMSKLQGNREQMATTFRRLVKLMAYVIFPIMLGIAAVASPLVRGILGEKWADSIPYTRLLALTLFWYPLHSINLMMLMVLGRTDLFLRLSIIQKICTVIILSITMHFGLMFMLKADAVLAVAALLINAYFSEQLVGVSVWRQLIDVLPILGLAAAMALIAYGATLLFDAYWLQLVSAILLGIVFYIAASKMLGWEQLNEVVRFVKFKKL